MTDRQMLVVILSVGIITLWFTLRASEGLTSTDMEIAAAFIAGGSLVWVSMVGRKK